MKKLRIWSMGVLLIAFPINAFKRSPIDVTLIGRAKYENGLGRIGIGIIDTLGDKLKINHISIHGKKSKSKEIPDFCMQKLNTARNPGNVALLYFPLWTGKKFSLKRVPKESLIKLAYSMFESTYIPDAWVSALNSNFDAVVVPDAFLVDVYQESGVEIPIFVLPHGVYMESYLSEPTKQGPSKPFIFGSNAVFQHRKNQLMLINSFCAEFADNPDVELHLHGVSSDKHYLKLVEKLVEKRGKGKVKLIHANFSDKEYKEFLKTLDCYVLLSKAEGFSVTPRESLALGIPTIITDNTCHTTICNSGFVKRVPSDNQEVAIYRCRYNFGYCGDEFSCTLKDSREALRDMYENYDFYKKKALEGRKWVQRYLWKNLEDEFLALLKPERIILGTNNILEKGCLTTSSEKLYAKYQKLFSESND